MTMMGATLMKMVTLMAALLVAAPAMVMGAWWPVEGPDAEG